MFTDRGNIKYKLGELVWIAGSFGHEASMPQVSGYFETETLPSFRLASLRLRAFAILKGRMQLRSAECPSTAFR